MEYIVANMPVAPNKKPASAVLFGTLRSPRSHATVCRGLLDSVNPRSAAREGRSGVHVDNALVEKSQITHLS